MGDINAIDIQNRIMSVRPGLRPPGDSCESRVMRAGIMDKVGWDKVMWGNDGWGLKRCKEEFMRLPIRDGCKNNILHDNVIEVSKLDLQP